MKTKLRALSFNGHDFLIENKINEAIEAIEDDNNNMIEKIDFVSFDRANIIVFIVYRELDSYDSVNQGLEYLVKCDSNEGGITF